MSIRKVNCGPARSAMELHGVKTCSVENSEKLRRKTVSAGVGKWER